MAIQQHPGKLFVPSSEKLMAMIAAAEEKFAIDRERTLEDLANQKPEYVRRGELRELVEGTE